MQKMIGIVAALAMVATAMPASADSGLFERNYNFLLGLLPEGGVIEVQILDETGNVVTQLWSAEQFAAFRASYASIMGKDYTAGFQGAPSGAGNNQAVGDTWGDFWGPSASTNVAIPRGLSRPLIIDNEKLWLYGGSGSQTGIYEHPGGCVHLFSFFTICSSVYGWTYPQSAYEVGATWLAQTGFVFNFGSPFGALTLGDAVALSE